MAKRPYVKPELDSRPCWITVAFGQSVYVLEHLCRRCGQLWSTAFYGAASLRPLKDRLVCPNCDARQARTLTREQAALASLETPARRRVLAWSN